MSDAASPPLATRTAAELLGTALLLIAVVGSGIMAERLAAGNGALALLCNAIATGAALVVLILMLGPVSGAHFNPVVSVVMRLQRALPMHETIAYALAQTAGGVIGVLMAHLMFGLPVFELSEKARTGGGQWLAELVAAFGLVLTILLVSRSRPESVAVAVGLYISSAYWFTASTSFANPAVTFARSLTDTFTGIRLADVPAFVVAQLLGGIAARGVANAFSTAAPER